MVTSLSVQILFLLVCLFPFSPVFHRNPREKMLPTDEPVILFQDKNIWLALLTILLHLVLWNLIAQWEDKKQYLAKIFKSPKIACDSLVVLIMFSSLYRNLKFLSALGSQPRWIILQNNAVLLVGYCCMLFGCMCVFSSIYTLGFCQTFLGDYYSIIMDRSSLRYSIKKCQNPVCWGSVLLFLSIALLKASFTGLILTVFVTVCYKFSLSCQRSYIQREYSNKLKTG